MPKVTLDLPYEVMDSIVVETLKDTHLTILKIVDHDENDDAMLRAIEEVLKYYMAPKDYELWSTGDA